MHPAPVKSPSCQSLQACPATKIPPPPPTCLPIHPTLVIPGNILYKVSRNLELAILSYCSWRERCRSYMCELFCSLARFSLLFNLTLMSFFFLFFLPISKLTFLWFLSSFSTTVTFYFIAIYFCVMSVFLFMNRNYMYSNSFWYYYIISMLLDTNPLTYEFVASEFVAFLRCLMILGWPWFHVLDYDHRLTPWLFLVVTFLVISLVYV